MPCQILIAEDDPDLQRLFVKAFQSSEHCKDFIISTANDGNLVIECLDNNLPDLLILDVGIPYRSGLEILQYVRELEKTVFTDDGLPRRVKVVMVTGNARAQNSPIADLADLFLLKPVSIRDLVTLVQRLQ